MGLKYKIRYTNDQLDTKIEEQTGNLLPPSLKGTGTNKLQKLDLFHYLLQCQVKEGDI